MRRGHGYGEGTRSSALWGRGSKSSRKRAAGVRAAVGAATLLLTLVVGVGTSAAGGPKDKDGSKGKGPKVPYTSTASYKPGSLLADAQANPLQMFKVIVQTQSRPLQNELARWSDENGKLKRQFRLIDGVSALLPGWALLNISEDPHLFGKVSITRDAPVTLASTSAAPVATTWQTEVGADRLWTQTAATPAIAIVDSGIDASKAADFGSRVVARADFTGDGKSGDPEGHGTMVAGVAAGAATGDTAGGIAQSAPLVDVRVADEIGEARTSDVIAGLDWVFAHRADYHIGVVNLSLAGNVEASFRFDPLDKAVEKLWLNGIVVTAAAGNNGTADGPVPLGAPGNDPFIITVGALDTNDTVDPSDDYRAPWSAYGYTADGFVKPELSAPGRRMVMPVPNDAYIPKQVLDRVVAPGYMWMSGTSFAAPIAAGAAAQLLALHPGWTPDQVKGALMATASPIAGAGVGIGEANVAAAAALSSPPNPNDSLGAFVHTDPDTGLQTFDSDAWTTAASTSGNWTSGNWTSGNWTSGNWTSGNWTSGNWTSGNWTSGNWVD